MKIRVFLFSYCPSLTCFLNRFIHLKQTIIINTCALGVNLLNFSIKVNMTSLKRLLIPNSVRTRIPQYNR